MNILFIVPYVPNLVRTRPYNLIKQLSALGHRVTVKTVWADDQERADLEALTTICHDVQAIHIPIWRSLLNSGLALPGKRPLQSVYSWQPSLLTGTDFSQFDLVHVEHLRGSRYGLAVKQQTDLPVVWDSVDCISHLFAQAVAKSTSTIGRLRSRLELERTRLYEGWLLDKFDRILVTSPQDKEGLLALADSHMLPNPVVVLPNGVDLQTFRPDEPVTRDPATLVISGKMSYHANVSMVQFLMQQIMPLVWQQRPDVRVQIVGKDPTADVQAWADDERVLVTGTVPAIEPYLQRATAAVTPLTYSAGIQNKVLEAMACGTPVITTSQAIAAIDVVPGQELLVADTAVSFAESIVTLLDQPARQRAVGTAGRRYVEMSHDWRQTAVLLTEQYEAVLRESHNGGKTAVLTDTKRINHS